MLRDTFTLNDRQICERAALEEGLPDLDPIALEAIFNQQPDSAIAYDWTYRNLNDFRHKTYLMEKGKEKRKRSNDSIGLAESGGSLASSVPEDLRIATPEESPTIRRRTSAQTPAKPRETVATLGDRMETSLAEINKAHETLKAAMEEVRLIAKEAEKTNEMLLEKLTQMETQMSSMQKQFGTRDSNIEALKHDISSLKRQFDLKAISTTRSPTSTTSVAGSASTSASRPATAIKSGTVAKAPAKSGLGAPFRPPGLQSSKKPDVVIKCIENLDDEFCPKCNEDYPANTKHVCA